jgi:hypothetical protein
MPDKFNRRVGNFTIGTLISRIAGLGRESVFAYLFGAGFATDDRFAEHLMILYWIGKIHHDETDGLIDLFYTKAPEKLLAHSIWFIGNILYNEKKTIEPVVLDRLMKFWEWRIQDTKRPISKIERRDFGQWFASAKFEDAWALRQLRDVLNNVGDIDSSYMVSEHILNIVSKMPLDVIECLHIVVEKSKDSFDFYGWEKNARNIISAVIKSKNDKAKQLAIDIAHLLVAKGYLKYRDLLP